MESEFLISEAEQYLVRKASGVAHGRAQIESSRGHGRKGSETSTNKKDYR